MPLNRPAAIVGSAILAPSLGDQYSMEEQLYNATQQALKDAGMTIEDIDGIVVGSCDQVDGRAISVMMASGSVGGVDRDILSTPSAGEHALFMGMLRVASGQFETQLVLAWGVTEADSLSEVERIGADPLFHRRLPQDDLATFALQANVLIDKHPQAAKVAAALVETNRKRGALAYPGVTEKVEGVAAIEASAPTRWPIRAGMVGTPVAGFVALVLASEQVVKDRGIKNPAWIKSAGWATEAAFMGDRELDTAPALAEALRQACADSGMKSVAEADVVEVFGPTPYQELLAYQVLGLGGPDQWTALADGSARGPKLNPSGGMAAINAVYCGGLLRIAEAANQVRGTAGAHQVSGVKRAVAHAASGPAMMYQSVVVLDREL